MNEYHTPQANVGCLSVCGGGGGRGGGGVFLSFVYSGVWVICGREINTMNTILHWLTLGVCVCVWGGGILLSFVYCGYGSSVAGK